jgi:hypothetical protein
MTMPDIRVFNTVLMQRIGLQNNVLRRLRGLGCKILEANLDNQLSICIDASTAQNLRQQKGGMSTRRLGRGEVVVSVDVDGCCVSWKEIQQ